MEPAEAGDEVVVPIVVAHRRRLSHGCAVPVGGAPVDGVPYADATVARRRGFRWLMDDRRPRPRAAAASRATSTATFEALVARPPGPAVHDRPADARRPGATPRRRPRTPSSGPTGRWPATTPARIRELRLRGWLDDDRAEPAAASALARRSAAVRRRSRSTTLDLAGDRAGRRDRRRTGGGRRATRRARDLGAPAGRRCRPPTATAVVLRHVDGLSYPEIAAALGRPEGTVKAQVHRGLAAAAHDARGRAPPRARGDDRMTDSTDRRPSRPRLAGLDARRPRPTPRARTSSSRSAWPTTTPRSTRRSGRSSWPGTAAACRRSTARRDDADVRGAPSRARTGRPAYRADALPPRLGRRHRAPARRRPPGPDRPRPARPHRRSSRPSGRRRSRSRAARSGRTAGSPPRSAGRRRSGRSGRRSATTRSRSSCRATASSGPTASIGQYSLGGPEQQADDPGRRGPRPGRRWRRRAPAGDPLRRLATRRTSCCLPTCHDAPARSRPRHRRPFRSLGRRGRRPATGRARHCRPARRRRPPPERVPAAARPCAGRAS